MPPSISSQVLNFLTSVNITTGSIKDPTLDLLDHIIECMGALKEVNMAYRAEGSVDSRGVGTRALYGFFVELGRLLTDTIAFTPPEEQTSSCCDGFSRVAGSILRVFPDLANQQNYSTGRVMLHHAAYKCNPLMGPKIVKMIIDANPSGALKVDITGALPLHWAASADKVSPDVIQLLVDANEDGAAAADENGSLPLHWAVDRENTNDKVVEILLRAYPAAAQQPGRDGMLPLHWAVNRPKPSLQTVLALIRANPAALRSQSPDGLLPLHLAASQPSPDPEVIDVLLQSYPDASRCLDAYGRYPIHLASSAASPNAEVVTMLIKACPESLSQGDAAGWLPIHLAAWASGGEAGPSIDVIRAIAEKNPNGARAATRGGLLPLHCAVSVPSPSCEVAALLLSLYPAAATTVAQGEPEGGPGFGRWTPLTRATERGLRPLAALLTAAEEDDEDDDEAVEIREKSWRGRAPPPRIIQHRSIGRGRNVIRAGGRAAVYADNDNSRSPMRSRGPQLSSVNSEIDNDNTLRLSSPTRNTRNNNTTNKQSNAISAGNTATPSKIMIMSSNGSPSPAPKGPTNRHIAPSPGNTLSKVVPITNYDSPEEMV